ncbi:MAG: hypothetical protein ACREGR_04535 [Minisyncoccia bacterium]
MKLNEADCEFVELLGFAVINGVFGATVSIVYDSVLDAVEGLENPSIAAPAAT